MNLQLQKGDVLGLNNNETKHCDIENCFPVFLLTSKVICQISAGFHK